MTFIDNGDGTATLAGTPASGTAGTYPITITAANGVSPDATQGFTLTVRPAPSAPTITSATTTTFTEGSAGTFTVTTTGNPDAALSETGTLPSGVTFTDNGNGTATLAGTPAAGPAAATRSPSPPPTAWRPTPPRASPSPCDQAPTITSGASTTFTVGSAGTFTVTTTGNPTPSLSETGHAAQRA